MSNSTVSILGCGWLGFPLAKSLLSKNFLVKGSTTTPEKLDLLESNGIAPFFINLSERIVNTEFFDTDYMIINIPPRARSGSSSNMVDELGYAMTYINERIKGLLFVSSTSVYGTNQGKCNSSTGPIPTKAGGKILLTSEEIIKSLSLPVTILRLGGLFGPDRNPGILTSGKKLECPEAMAHYIYQNDLINLIETILSKNYWGKLVLGVYPPTKTRKEFYTESCLNQGLPPPYFEGEPGNLFLDPINEFKDLGFINYTYS